MKEKIFAFAGKRLKQLESRKDLCIHRPKLLDVSTGGGYKNSMERIQCLYCNVIDFVFVATSQSIIDRKERILLLHISQLALIRVPSVQ